MNILLKPLIPELEAVGLPWRAERGKRHIKIFVAGHLVGVVPTRGVRLDWDNRRAFYNVRAQIRRTGRLVNEH